MSHTFSLVDSLALDDLHTFLSRAGRIEEGSVRLIAGSGVLAAYVAVLYPVGLRDESPTVLGLRTFALTDEATFDAVVPLRSLIERLVRLQGIERDQSEPVTVGLPIEVNTATWAAISPPRGGWLQLEPTEPRMLETVAKSGIDEIKEAVPDEIGEQILRRVRSEVWSRPIEGLEHVPAGAAFAAMTLGFLATDEPVTIYETGPWTRLTSLGGHTLVRRKSWTLLH
ncbi:MAG TPA: hypothetical protein VFT01_03395 [Homoserinimonas sp.]|nr:hypothetical protein [Homoserinimonas sp.]